MTAEGIPLPTDAELTPEAREILGALPPLNVFRAVAALPASLRPFLELGGSLLERHQPDAGGARARDPARRAPHAARPTSASSTSSSRARSG